MEAAENGFSEAQFHMGILSQTNKNRTNAAKWYGLSAQKGHVAAQLRLALLGYNAKGIPSDNEINIDLLRRAAKGGHRITEYALGLLYYYGIGTPQDKKIGIYWLENAAQKGHELAQVFLDLNKSYR